MIEGLSRVRDPRNAGRQRSWYRKGIELPSQNDNTPRALLPEAAPGAKSVSMEPASKEYVDLKLDAALAPILAKLDSIEKNQLLPKQLWTAAGTTIAAVAGIVVAVLAIGGDRFDGGMAASGVISSMTQEQQARDRAQDEKLDAVISRLDALLDAQATPTTPVPESPTE